jgi:hypothetical protein
MALAGDDDLPQFPKIAPPDPLPDAACETIAKPLEWGFGEWVNDKVKVHVEKTKWTITGGAKPLSGSLVQTQACEIDLSTDQSQIFAGVRAEDGHMLAALWDENGKPHRLNLKRP